MKNNIRLAGKAERYYQVSAAIATLMLEKIELVKEIKKLARVNSVNKQVTLLTTKHRLLISWIKRCKVPTFYRDGHAKVRIALRPEWIAKHMKEVRELALVSKEID